MGQMKSRAFVNTGRLRGSGLLWVRSGLLVLLTEKRTNGGSEDVAGEAIVAE